MCALVLGFFFLTRRGRIWILSPECKTVQAHFTDWISFLPSDPKDKIIPNLEASAQIPKAFNQHGIPKTI